MSSICTHSRYSKINTQLEEKVSVYEPSDGIESRYGKSAFSSLVWLGLAWLGLTGYCIQFSDDNRDGQRNAGSLAVPVPDG